MHHCRSIGSVLATLLALLFAAVLPARAQSPAFQVDPVVSRTRCPTSWIFGQVGGISVEMREVTFGCFNGRDR